MGRAKAKIGVLGSPAGFFVLGAAGCAGRYLVIDSQERKAHEESLRAPSMERARQALVKLTAAVQAGPPTNELYALSEEEIGIVEESAQ